MYENWKKVDFCLVGLVRFSGNFSAIAYQVGHLGGRISRSPEDALLAGPFELGTASDDDKR